MSIISLNDAVFNVLECPDTDPRLLPSWWRGGDNAARVQHYRIALHKAINICISAQQRRLLELYHVYGVSCSEIARRQNRGRAAVARSIHTAERALREYVELYMEIYDTLERELYSEDER